MSVADAMGGRSRRKNSSRATALNLCYNKPYVCLFVLNKSNVLMTALLYQVRNISIKKRTELLAWLL